MRSFLLFISFSLSANNFADAATFSNLSIDIADEWAHEVITADSELSDRSELISIYSPSGVSELKMQSFTLPEEIDRERLRLLTNLDFAITLPWNIWSNLSGYEYSYTEGDQFLKQWWLVSGRTVLFVTYSAPRSLGEIELDAVDNMVESIEIS